MRSRSRSIIWCVCFVVSTFFYAHSASASISDKAEGIGETIYDNSRILAGTKFNKKWTLKNVGTSTWTSSYKLKYVSNQNGRLSDISAIEVADPVKPGETYTFIVPMTAPDPHGSIKKFKEEWEFINPSGMTVNVINDSPTISVLIQSIADIEHKDGLGFTAINDAGYRDDVDYVSILINAGAKVDARPDNEGQTALMHAASNGYVSVMELLLKSGADPNLETKGKCTALTFAIRCKHPLAVAALIKGGANIEQKDERGRTAINEAGYRDNVDVVATLIKAGSKVDARDNKGWTALMNAAYYGYASVVELLLKSGANPNLETTEENKFTALKYAIQQKHPQAVAALIKGGANIEQKDERGRTAINESGYWDNVDVVATLIKAGAKVDARDKEGSTALMNAAYKGYASVVELLLKSGANPNLETTGENKFTALKYAIQQKHPQAVAALIKGGANIEHKNETGRPPIINAGFIGNVDVVATLIQAGAKVDARDNEGHTALMAAAQKGHAPVVEFLLKSGANPNLEDKNEYTALTFAAENGQIEIIQILERYGIKKKSVREAKVDALKSTKVIVENLSDIVKFADTPIGKLERSTIEDSIKNSEAELKEKKELFIKLKKLYCSDPELMKLDVCKCQ